MPGPDVADSADVPDSADDATADHGEVRRDLQQALLSGVAITIPFFVTVLVIVWVLNAVSNALSPLVGLLNVLGPVGELSVLVREGLAAAVVFGLILGVGLVAQHGPETRIEKRVDALMGDLPGIGSIYTSVDRMSQVMVEGDADSFQEVKLVEFPREGSFAIAFLTADAPPEIEAAAGHEEMHTVFVPMAPNPVMGGHLLTLPDERIRDVDLTVEEGMQAIVSTGLAIDESAGEQ